MFTLDYSVGDGGANNGWCQEVPDQITKIRDNVLSVGRPQHRPPAEWPARQGEVGEDEVEGAVWVQPGKPKGTWA